MSDQLNELVECHEFHYNNRNYEDCFSFCVTLSILYINSKFKIRIFNSFFKQEELYYFRATNNRIYITSKKYKNDNWDFRPPSNRDMFDYKLLAGFRYNGGFREYKLCGYYVKSNTYVLCTMPHAKTLIKSYINDAKSTIHKLSNFCPNPYLAINEAKTLVEKHG